ncbi:16S rRNA (cytidine(1402)-2'-O)-methyltransferase [bacterium]|nr:16S rRNA (cytidine(1402)-2'-O)-methyltransferase [bacterium]MBT3581317.1 16S rRNA (cytidine(1402)-2'-O)-methyltransferase [bacterium]MBT4552103.1 16S rRNA (cytidine(1402)-2'-O)-methyltransferase [bacterium]
MTKPQPGELYICGTPIGNLQDCSSRLLTTLQTVDMIAAEDTRTAQKLLQKFNIKKPLISLQKHNEKERLKLLTKYLSNSKSLALISDAGTPNIADPGAYIIRQLLEQGFQIIPIPGPSAVTTILSICGILADQFCFLGFFPKKNTDAQKLLVKTSQNQIPCIFFESPKRLLKTLDFLETIPSIKEIFLAKELTKLHEKYFFGTITKVKNMLSTASSKGEWCFVLTFQAHKSSSNSTEAIIEIQKMLDLGLNLKQILGLGEKYLKLSKNEIKKIYYTIN